MPVWLCDSYDETHPARRELIRLLSSRLPVGKIPGIWEFILPLFYNSLSHALFIAFILGASESEHNHQSIFALTILFVPVTSTCLLFSAASASASSTVTVTYPLILRLYHSPLLLIRLVSSSSCNHVVRPFFQSHVLQASRLLAYRLPFPTPE